MKYFLLLLAVSSVGMGFEDFEEDSHYWQRRIYADGRGSSQYTAERDARWRISYDARVLENHCRHQGGYAMTRIGRPVCGQQSINYWRCNIAGVVTCRAHDID